MKTSVKPTNCSGLTLIELLVVIAVIIVMIAALLGVPGPRDKQRALGIVCLSYQKQLALGFTMWQGDNGNRYPWQIPATNNGTLESSAKGDAAANFNVLNSYIQSSRVFKCPTDNARTMLTNATVLQNQNISYFVGLDFDKTNEASSILTGDRHLEANLQPVRSGLFVYSKGMKMNWTSELHGSSPSSPVGMMSFYDGHAAATPHTDIDVIFQNENLATSRFDVP